MNIEYFFVRNMSNTGNENEPLYTYSKWRRIADYHPPDVLDRLIHRDALDILDDTLISNTNSQNAAPVTESMLIRLIKYISHEYKQGNVVSHFVKHRFNICATIAAANGYNVSKYLKLLISLILVVITDTIADAITGTWSYLVSLWKIIFFIYY